ncbi:MAG: universal stress protein [Gammaproteobacteria bacterium]|nr:universal stress protein [Gammaproteobacteria bacterium]MCP5424452.1 universal stress protein [Gammaproteobacteria bacterium]MCP5458446.1 universal stress protein [Gammaproteobacteria bacterium]
MYTNILLTVDLNQESSWIRALPVAVEYCKAFGAKLHIMTVVPSFGMPIVASFFPDDYASNVRAEVNDRLHALMREHVSKEVACQHIIAEGVVYEEIIETAKKIDADLIIMAAHRPDLRDFLLGPNAARVVRHSDKSVLVVRD